MRQKEFSKLEKVEVFYKSTINICLEVPGNVTVRENEELKEGRKTGL